MSTFQLTLIGIFIFALVVGVLVFAGILPGFRPPTGGVGGTVTLWGTIPKEAFDQTFEKFREAHRGDFTLVYEAKSPTNFDATLIDALAAGVGPDLVIMPASSIAQELNKIAPIPYPLYSERTFEDSFIGEGKLYLFKDGIVALPTVVDPLVMYVNTDLLTSGRLPLPPKTWTELQAEIKNLTIADLQGNISQSAIPIGQFNNIAHAKDILTLLLLQAGNPLVTLTDNGLDVTLKDSFGTPKPPAIDAVNFFNRFANPTDPLYSWNSALPEARDSFARGNAVFYLGYASEVGRIRQQNPQLNFDVAIVPQASNRSNLTLGQLYGVSVMKSSKNPQTALSVATLLSSKDGAALMTQVTGLPAARKDLLGEVPRDPIQTVFNQAAILSYGWLDPDPAATQGIFNNLIDAVAVRGVKPDLAVVQADQQIQTLFSHND